MIRKGFTHKQPVHPLRTQRAMEALIVVSGLALLFIVALWTTHPIKHTPITPIASDRLDDQSSSEPGSVDPVDDVDPAFFDVTLWNPPPPPPEPTKPEPAPQAVAVRVVPLNVHLLAIVRREHDGQLAAMLYDAKSDTLFTLGVGEAIMGHTIQSVEGDVVLFKAESTETRLSLMPEERR